MSLIGYAAGLALALCIPWFREHSDGLRDVSGRCMQVALFAIGANSKLSDLFSRDGARNFAHAAALSTLMTGLIYTAVETNLLP